MTARIEDQLMTAEYDGRVIATARYSPEAADGRDAWMVLAERLAAGYGDDDPFVIGWREELGL
jgi:hypothetical protein